MTDYKAELVAVFGQPVAENPTGVMQEAAFADAGLNWRYLTVEVAPDKLTDAVNGARAMGFRGFNLTIPHKVAVMRLLDEIAPEARMIGAVNTVRRDGDRFVGENTDGKGFLRGLRADAGIDPAGKRVVVLGAGGAARAVATELALAGAAEITVVNRSPERGEAMTDDLRRNVRSVVRSEIWAGAYRLPAETDILVNATSVGLYPDIDAMPAVDLSTARALVCDVVFNPPETRLLRAARERGLPVLDGLSMLVYQGVIGFELWTGRPAPESVMKEALRSALTGASGPA
jgi:shikimate dehydrogenase